MLFTSACCMAVAGPAHSLLASPQTCVSTACAQQKLYRVGHGSLPRGQSSLTNMTVPGVRQVDKHRLVSELGVNYRDVRILDPMVRARPARAPARPPAAPLEAPPTRACPTLDLLLRARARAAQVPTPSPSTIFIRDKAILVNLESLRMIICHDKARPCIAILQASRAAPHALGVTRTGGPSNGPLNTALAQCLGTWLPACRATAMPGPSFSRACPPAPRGTLCAGSGRVADGLAARRYSC